MRGRKEKKENVRIMWLGYDFHPHDKSSNGDIFSLTFFNRISFPFLYDILQQNPYLYRYT